jgi:hypothetical protein
MKSLSNSLALFRRRIFLYLQEKKEFDKNIGNLQPDEAIGIGQ